MESLGAETRMYGEEAIVLEGEGFEATIIPAFGGNLARLRHTGTGLDVLRSPADLAGYLENVFLCGSPVLFPPNRIADGVFSEGDHTYRLKINEPSRGCHLHGFAYDKAWQVVSAPEVRGPGHVAMEWRAADFPDVQEQYPHRMALRLEYALKDGALWQTIRATNEGDTYAPCGLGFHTTFALPLRNGGDPALCTVSLPLGKQWELNDRLLPTEKLLDLPDLEQWRTGKVIAGLPLDDVFTSEPDPSLDPNPLTSGVRTHTAVLQDNTDALDPIQVQYTCQGPIQHWVIYNRDGNSGYVSIEPYTWVTNAPNLSLPRDVTGYRVLAPGEHMMMTNSIRLIRSGVVL
ncbi:MAG: aldose 1-epimerase [Firmicutes bacterium]|nr:aldose 1-epimerase [Bacillota bacterium]